MASSWYGEPRVNAKGVGQDGAGAFNRAQWNHPVRQDSRKVLTPRHCCSDPENSSGRVESEVFNHVCPSAGRLHPMTKTKQEPPENPSWWWRMGHLLDRVLDVVSVVPLLGWLIRIIGR